MYTLKENKNDLEIEALNIFTTCETLDIFLRSENLIKLDFGLKNELSVF